MLVTLAPQKSLPLFSALATFKLDRAQSCLQETGSNTPFVQAANVTLGV
jgi:hypothetical protein